MVMTRPCGVTRKSQNRAAHALPAARQYPLANDVSGKTELANGGAHSFAAALPAKTGPIEQDDAALHAAARQVVQLGQPIGRAIGGDDDGRAPRRAK